MHSRPDSSRGAVGSIPRRLQIVVVDEDPEILALWAAALNADSYEVAVAASEQELARGLRAKAARARAAARRAAERAENSGEWNGTGA
jgi:CheY-like chemotaxis protein